MCLSLQTGTNLVSRDVVDVVVAAAAALVSACCALHKKHTKKIGSFYLRNVSRHADSKLYVKQSAVKMMKYFDTLEVYTV